MSFYESLDVLVGAGLLAIAPAADVEIPQAADVSGAGFSAFLRDRGEAGLLGGVLDRLAHQIWLSQDTRGIPMHVAEEQARRLASLIDSSRPAPSEVLAAAGQGWSTAAAQLAAVILASAAVKQETAGGQLSEHVAQFLLEQLFLQLGSDQGLMRRVGPLLQEFLARRSPGSEASAVPVPVQLRTEVTGAPPRAEVARFEKPHGLSDRALARFSAIAERHRALPARESWQVAELVQWLRETRDHLTRPSNESAEVRKLKRQAAEALTEGDFEAAMEFLQEVRSKLRAERRRTEDRLKEELGQLRAQVLQEAFATADLAELAMAQLDFRGAAALFQEAAEIAGDSDAIASLRFTLRRGDALCYAGEEAGDTTLLRDAVGSYARAVELAGSAGEVGSLASASQGLGNAFLAIAEHEPSKALYEQASIAFRTALEVLRRESDPRVWALARLGLGNALASMCEVEAASVATLEQAAVAYKGALEVLSRDSEPLRWAVARLNMATVLIRLGEFKDKRANWLAAAAAIVPALEVFEEKGAALQADAARRALRLIHSRWQALEPPAAAE